MTNAFEVAEIEGDCDLSGTSVLVVESDDLETSAPVEELASVFSATLSMPLKSGRYEKWIDRVDVSDPVKGMYDTLAEATDGDGIKDYLIDNCYLQGTAEGDSIYYVVGDEKRPCLLFFMARFSPGDNDEMVNRAEELRHCIRIAFSAFDRDYPEVFWMVPSIDYAILVNQTQGVAYGGIYIDRAVLPQYADENRLRESIANRNTWAQRILEESPSSNDPEGRIRFFNEWLTKNNEYNTSDDLDTLYSSRTYNDAWECVSALEGREGDKGPVCEAYARAFKLLCDSSGIPCVIVDGTALSSIGSGGRHMWNYVKLGDAWYGVDVTWDDPRVAGVSGKLSGYEREDYLLVGGDTPIGSMNFLTSHPETNAVITGYEFSNGPELSSEKYVRDCSKMGHVFGDATILNVKEPACEADGSHDEKRVCKYCAHEEVKSVAEVGTATGHEMGAWAAATAATCEAAGTEVRSCTHAGCTRTETRDVAALGHAMQGWEVVTPATCTVSGVEQRRCSREGCSQIETRAIKAMGHAPGAWTTTRAATCTVPGAEERRCTRAGCFFVEARAIPAAGHAFGAYRANGDAKVGVNGTETATCARCGARTTRTAAGSALVPAVGQAVTVGGVAYTATGAATVAYAGPASKTTTSATVPATVTISGRTYQVTAIAPGAFAGNKKLKSVKIGANVTAIPANAFKGCTALASVSFGANVKTIGAKAFYGCKALKSVTLGAKITSIGASAFQNCSKLTKVTVKSKSLKSIGKSAFAGCKALKSVALSSTKLTIIGASAFSGCKKLKTLALKTTKLKSVGKSALKGAGKKLVVKVPKSKVKAYQKLFKNKGLKTVRVKK